MIDGPLTGHTYCNDRLTVLGYISNSKHGKRYLVHCPVCAEDPEQYGEGNFESYASNIKKGAVPCGCSRSYCPTDTQLTLRLERASKDSKYKFIKLSDIDSKRRKAVFSCQEHGEYLANCHDFLAGKRCLRCTQNALKPDEVMIAKFKASGVYSDNTSFTRSDKKDSKGAKVYWNVVCAICNETYTGHQSHLKLGKQGCSCSTKSSRFCYLLRVYEGVDIGVKFGISKNPKRRLVEHEKSCKLSLELIGLWEFNTAQDCKDAELECKRTFVCGIIGKELFPDGYTETTYSYNIEAIQEVYEKHGGFRLW